ncbi:unnamed protein product [Psylliodes chrysocephalus]|uniref:Peptidase S1 domain-containing protein n=1 Tax=Psylliodes chrysocephalus TaxID=3402493 RepID=A0A9P0GAJ6_9CUCU|nr:unnamed protein product [Psylliodes chrysocephala]
MNIILILGLVAPFVSAGSYRNEVMSHTNWRLIDTNQCGLVKLYPRITKGENAKISRFPWMVQVLQRNVIGKNRIVDKYVCSGALINKQYAVTAAHCVAGNERITKFIRLGESVNVVCAQSLDDCLSRRVKIEEIIVHEQYDGTTFENDIALIRLDDEVKFNTNVIPVCLPTEDLLEYRFLGEKVEIAGWGLDSSEVPSQILKFVTLPIRDRCVCEGIFNQTVDERQLCIGVETGEDTCQGDSGSPVVWKRQEHFQTRHYFIGLTSYANDEDCGEGPALYTNLNQFVKWILNNMYGSEYDLLFGHGKPEIVSKPEPEIVSKPNPEIVSKPEPEIVSEPAHVHVLKPEIEAEDGSFISNEIYSESDSDSEE